MLLRGALGSAVLHPRTAKPQLEANTQAAPMSPWDSSCSRLCKAKPCALSQYRFIVMPVCRIHKYSNFPEALMADAFITTLSAFPIVFALGSNVSFSHRAWPWEILNAKSTWAQEGAGLPSSGFSPLQKSHLHPQEKSWAFPWTCIFINNHGLPVFTYNKNQMSFRTPKITTGTDTTS